MKYPREWIQDRFFKGFFASLVKNGNTIIGIHKLHNFFNKELDELNKLEQFPKFFVKSSITGFNTDLNNAIHKFQNRLLILCENYIIINCSFGLAEMILYEYTKEEQEIFTNLVNLIS